MANSSVCSKAFENAGLTSVSSMIDTGNLIFVREGLLQSPTNNNSWLGSEELRTGMNAEFKKSLTVNGATPVGQVNGNYYVSLRIRTFTGKDDTPKNIIIHELIHAGGASGSYDSFSYEVVEPKTTFGKNQLPIANPNQGRKEMRTLFPKHDLEWMNYKDGKYVGVYDQIIKNCQSK